MANTLTSVLTAAVANNAGAGSAIYSPTAGKTCTLIGLHISNNSTTAVVSVQVTLTRGGTTVNLIPPGANIPVGGTLACVGNEGKIVVLGSDIVKVIPTGGTVDTIVSVLEQS